MREVVVHAWTSLDGFSADTQLVVKDHAVEAFAPKLFLAPTAQ